MEFARMNNGQDWKRTEEGANAKRQAIAIRTVSAPIKISL
jgi:hypothetical protein